MRAVKTAPGGPAGHEARLRGLGTLLSPRRRNTAQVRTIARGWPHPQPLPTAVEKGGTAVAGGNSPSPCRNMGRGWGGAVTLRGLVPVRVGGLRGPQAPQARF